MTKSGGSGTATIEPAFNNTGTTNVQNGTLKLTGGGASSGTFNPSAGAILQFAGGTHTLDGVTFAGSGTVQIAMDSVNTTGSGATVNAATTLAQSGGVQGGNGPMTVNGVFDWSGGEINGSGPFTVNDVLNFTGVDGKWLNQRTITNNGAANVTGAGKIYFQNGAIFDNQAGATFDIQTDVTLEHYSGAATTFNNAGTLTKSGGSGTATIEPAFNNTGTVEVQSGVLAFTGLFVQTAGSTRLNGGDISASNGLNIQGGLLQGHGTVTGDVSNGGQVSPGFSPAILHIVGDYTQTSGGYLNIEIGGYIAGTDFDQLTVSGNANLNGALNVSLINNFDPQIGDSFPVLVGSSTGAFSSTNLPALHPGREWDVVYGSTTLNVVQAHSTTTITSDTPDPSVVGQPVPVNFTVTSGGGTPTGDVTVSDGEGNSCTGSLSGGAGSCDLTPTSPGSKTLTANYPGDGNFSSSSDTEPHQVNKADTTTTITADDPDPSVVDQAVTVNYSVAAKAPGSGTPTGNVTVGDGDGNSCTGTVAAGSCSLTPTSAGAKTLTATYAGDANFNGSSGTEPHQVEQPTSTPTPIPTNTPTTVPLYSPTPTATPTPCWASLGGEIFDDLNGDGVYDYGQDPGLGDITVIITGPITMTTVSSAAGWWQVGGLPVGQYEVRAQAPAGYVLTTLPSYLVDIPNRCTKWFYLYFGFKRLPTATPTPTPTSTPTATLTPTTTPTAVNYGIWLPLVQHR